MRTLSTRGRVLFFTYLFLAIAQLALAVIDPSGLLAALRVVLAVACAGFALYSFKSSRWRQAAR